MTIKRWSAVAALVLTAPAAAQDLPADQVERHADVVRQDMLLNLKAAVPLEFNSRIERVPA